ncbi:tape measure protein [Marispirochaeta aestuarii]|uniref:tape measure protein n=1 Tax=Marispirochaeta aestuarii TaxID=1963862 RepID=UPI0029C64D7A|nr:tape measure protein [Marispirochaeta aestuarii]
MVDIASLGIKVDSREAKGATLDLDKLSRASDKAERSTSGLGSEARNTDQAFGSMGKSVGSALLKFGGLTAIVATMYKLSEASIKAAAAFETQRTEFGIFMQDMDMGASMFADIQTFAASTPLAVEQLSEVTKQLLSFGSEADEVLDQVRMLGDAALGNGQKLETLARAYGRVQARGKASMEEVNMAMEAGLPIIDELAKALGTSQAEIFDLISTGAVGFEEFQAAFKAMTSEGGKFNDGMSILAQTFEGKLSTAMDNVKLLGAEMFEPAMEGAKDFFDWISETTQGLRDFIAESKRVRREEEEYSQSTEGQLEAQMKRIAALRTQYLDEKAWVDEYDITSGSSLANLQRLEDQLDTELEILNAIEQQMMAEQRLVEAKEDAEEWARKLKEIEEDITAEISKQENLRRQKVIEDRVAAEAAYAKAVDDTYDRLNLGILSNEEAVRSLHEANKALINSLIEIGYNGIDDQLGSISLRGAIERLREYSGEMELNNQIIEAGNTLLERRGQIIVDGNEKLSDFDLAMKNFNESIIRGGVNEFADSIFDIGTAFGSGSVSAETFGAAVGNVALQLTRMIPTMAMAAGLQLLFQGDPRGWWLLGGGAFGMLGGGFIEGAIEENAHGNVYEHGDITPFANGGIVTKPTIFPMASGAGLMGEAGPEAIMPLARTASGDLGVRAAGGNMNVTIINNSSNSSVRTEEETGANGDKEVRVYIENLVTQGIARGDFDKAHNRRYGLVPKGVRV